MDIVAPVCHVCVPLKEGEVGTYFYISNYYLALSSTCVPLETGKVERGALLRVSRVEVAVGDIVDGCRRVNVPMQGRVVNRMTPVSVSLVQVWCGGRGRGRVCGCSAIAG